MFKFLKREARAAQIEVPRLSEPADFERARYPVLAAPFNGVVTRVILRELTQAQILACGNFSVIETFADKIARKGSKLTASERLEYADCQHAIAKAALVYPTYEQIMEVCAKDQKIIEARAELAALRERIKDTSFGTERSKLEELVDALLVWTDLILPPDFLAFIVSYAIGIDKSGIKTVSEEMLVNAAILAELGHDNPADHLRGPWSALPNAQFYDDDINTRAWILLAEKRERDKRK